MMKQPIFWATLLLSVVCGLLAQRLSSQSNSDFAYGQDLPEVLQLVDRAYVDKVQLGKLEPGLYQGALEALDENASYLPPGGEALDRAEDLYRRTGLAISKNDSYVFALAVAPGSPAEAAKIHAGDYLLSIAGVTTRSLSLYEARKRMADADSAVVLRLEGPNASDEEVKLEPVTSYAPPPPRLELQGGDLYNCRLNAFPKDWNETLKRLLTAVKEPDARLVLDLRGNALGTRQDLERLAALFLGKGMLAQWRSSKGISSVLENAEAGPYSGRPLYLLLDAATSGAAEEFAAIAKEHSAAKIIGRKTLGLARVYKFFPLSNGGFIQIAAEILELKDKNTAFSKGVTPDTDLGEREPTDERLLELVRETPFVFIPGKTEAKPGTQRSSLNESGNVINQITGG